MLFPSSVLQLCGLQIKFILRFLYHFLLIRSFPSQIIDFHYWWQIFSILILLVTLCVTLIVFLGSSSYRLISIILSLYQGLLSRDRSSGSGIEKEYDNNINYISHCPILDNCLLRCLSYFHRYLSSKSDVVGSISDFNLLKFEFSIEGRYST